ncbi:hypothetical protein E4T56_gene16831 [Termitomyces sp. T112]|nr:hypothetical protein E4T56_gene16831 [Termitomyces sp. T112]
MYKPEWKIPLPEPLPTELKPLHDVSHLMQDVWINCPTEEVPQWLSDSTVQEGIWAMLKTEWCTEELQQLHVEAINLSLWFSCELAAVELALIKPSNMSLHILLEQQHSCLLHLHSLWPSPFAPQHVFDSLISKAKEVVQTLNASKCKPQSLDNG